MTGYRKAIIIGASSGIGRELAKLLSKDGCELGLAARRTDLLESLQTELPEKSVIRKIDVSSEDAAPKIEELIKELGDIDLAVITAGWGEINPKLDWAIEKETIGVNVTGFTLAAGILFNYFAQKKAGHIAVVTSIAALRGAGEAPSYNASKAYQSNYLQGLRQKAFKLKAPITITDIQAGLIDTAMAKGDGLFWVMPVEKAAWQIYSAIRHRRKHAYVTKRWRIIAWLIRILPDWIYYRLG